MPYAAVRCGFGLAVVAATLISAHSAQAQGKVDARFSVSLGGLPIGKGAWVVDISNDRFSAAASGATAGFFRIFAKGNGSTASRGTVVGGAPVAEVFSASVSTDRWTDQIRMAFNGGSVKELALDPPIKPHPERVPITAAHRRGVVDPMTGSLARVPGNGDPLGPQACKRTISVFDGRMRYDLRMAYKRVEQVRADKGYSGPAVVCAVRFTPIAGHVPSRRAIRYMVDQRDVEVWLVPVAATRIVVPFRVAVPTPLGLGVLQATQFVTTPQPSRAAAAPSAR